MVSQILTGMPPARNAHLRPDTLVHQKLLSPDSASFVTGDTLQPADTLVHHKLLSPDSAFFFAGDTLLRADSVSAKVVTPEHSPRKASLYSALLPGLGQAYNRKYWKIPLIYAGFGAFGYFIGWNNGNYSSARQAYKDLTDDDPLTDSYNQLKQIIYFDLNNPSSVANLKQGLISSQDYYRRNRDLLVIIAVGFYGLNIIDASVDAHFFDFDIGDDLTFRLIPSLEKMSDQNIFSLHCEINF